jgi:alkaline phosphatase D
MGFSRREILKGMGAAGLTPLIVSTGCGSDDGGSSGPPLPELPEYEWNGELGPETLFKHGVASGDPLAEAVVIWTRISSEDAPEEPPESDDPLEVWWEVSLDEAFTQRVAQGTLRADPARDFTVKVDVTGLVWGRNYFYRFLAQGRQSPIGRTRLAPKGDETDRLRFGVCSCSNYGFGYFHGYRHMAERNDLDAVLHLGDYFYEYGQDNYPDPGPDRLRLVEPPTDTVTLSDYRIRFAQYREDEDLQECHRQHPFIVVWDDHESANNSWMGGAENHDEATQGSWDDRLASAREAFFEWIPIREDAAVNPNRELYRSFKYGDLADIIMLDTRIEGREEQGPLITVIPDSPNNPENIISETQEAWLKEQLSSSTAKWRIIGNQVVMSLWQFVDQNTNEVTYVNQDQWNGYPVGRARLLEYLRDNQISNVVVVTGDVHSSWSMDVTVGDGSYDPETGEGAVAVEFVAPGITSPFEVPDFIVGVFVEQSPHIYYSDVANRGYLVLDVQADKVQSDWYFVEGLQQDQVGQTLAASWAVLDGTAHVIEMDGEEAPNADAPPRAS